MLSHFVSLEGPVSEMLSRLHVTDETENWFPFHPEDEKDSVSRLPGMPVLGLGAPLSEEWQCRHYPQEGGLLSL